MDLRRLERIKSDLECFEMEAGGCACDGEVIAAVIIQSVVSLARELVEEVEELLKEQDDE